ncbi:MAG: IS1380 family transposase [Terriglobia bacterium]
MNKVQQTLLPIKLEPSEERLTSLGGLILVEELAQAKGLWGRVDELFPRPGSGRGYRASAYVKPLVWMLHAGGRRLEDVRELRAEQGVLKQLGLEELPSTDAVGDWLRRTGRRGVEALGPVNRELVASLLAAGPEELTLDVDATIIEAEKQEAEWTYTKVKGYQPLVGYVGGVVVHHEFRAGNESAGGGAVKFLQGCEAHLPARKRIYLRADSASYQAGVMNYCWERQWTFTITADQDCAVKAVIGQIPESDWKAYRTREGIATDREIAETVHCLNQSERSFRLVVVRWKNAQPSLFEAQKYCYHAVASNRDEAEGASEVLWGHNQRGESENCHKELKLGFGMEQMPCGQQEANALFFAIGVLAYNLSLVLKAKLLPPEYRQVSVATLRWKVYRLAGKLVRHARVWVLRVCAEGEKLALLEAARRKCYELSLSSA